ncbi:E6 protein [Crocuta crocuta papillomavirus 1]|uniref:Protein E6 n=1 Tax=Crocuta crocuta papillomavirus 1 TaxID=1104917 RepID=J7F282_9PAPI|nr:E6 protein [Crocuta crocuta papillomavirus 1]AER38247.1 E6 protein [Crocuta crocuta papillomavirus 1]
MKSGLGAFMERPTSVKGLSTALQIPFVDVLLACRFCLHFLTYIDKACFDEWPLTLQWINGCAFGCCLLCLKKCCYLEKALYFNRNLTESELLNLQLNLKGIGVRCGSCMKTLTDSEKDYCVKTNNLYLARFKIRGTCGLCCLC